MTYIATHIYTWNMKINFKISDWSILKINFKNVFQYIHQFFTYVNKLHFWEQSHFATLLATPTIIEQWRHLVDQIQNRSSARNSVGQGSSTTSVQGPEFHCEGQTFNKNVVCRLDWHINILVCVFTLHHCEQHKNMVNT